jgi:hypothetical protein
MYNNKANLYWPIHEPLIQIHSTQANSTNSDESRCGQKYVPFEENFILDILCSYAYKSEADRIEAEMISTLRTLGKNGYNVMNGNPLKDLKKFNYLQSKKRKFNT